MKPYLTGRAKMQSLPTDIKQFFTGYREIEDEHKEPP